LKFDGTTLQLYSKKATRGRVLEKFDSLVIQKQIGFAQKDKIKTGFD